MAKLPRKPQTFRVVVVKPKIPVGSRQAFAKKVEDLKFPAKLKLRGDS